ncbi:MAG: substrate-binding domain-containing protein, partial [Clostridiales Family XIII bacterium]|nr:substrate-binding domain-containing protein [Clostridiales Family XIII bacterium]
MKRRTILILFAVMLTAAMAFTGCGGGTSGGDDEAGAEAEAGAETEGEATEETAENDLTAQYHFGMNVWGTAPILELYGNEAVYAVETMGMTYDRASDDNNADKELQNIQNFISQGVDALAIQGAGATTIPQMAQMAASAEIPFGLYIFTGTPEVREALNANPYYAGAVASDLEADGRIIGEKAYADGARTACIIGGNKGDLNMDNRSKGFYDGFESAGGKVVAEERCTDNSEALAKAQSMFSANKDVDAVYIMVGDYTEGTFTAMDQLGITDCKAYLSAINAASAPFIKEGKIAAGSGGTTFACNIGPTRIINMLDGHVIKDADGNAPFFAVPTSLVTPENVDAYIEVFLAEGAQPITPAMIEKLCYRTNKDVTYDTYVESIANDFTV